MLGAMNKKERVGDYEKVITKAKSLNPDVAISCDIMVGFPAEDDSSFGNTVEFLKHVRPMRMHIFRFSPRQYTIFGSKEIRNSNQVHQRMEALKQLALEFSQGYREKFLGKTLVMVAEEKKDGLVWGYTQNYIRVCSEDEIALGQMIPVKFIRIDKDKTYVTKA